MGVLGLTPFLQRICPEVIKELPLRLKTLVGKTVAIDGTLITQRFHYSPLPHEHRHVLGWYRLISEFRDNGVGMVCVFDGKERSDAKIREVERRRAIRKLTGARGAMEVERSNRLRKLSAELREMRGFEERESLTIERSGWGRKEEGEDSLPIATSGRVLLEDLEEKFRELKVRDEERKEETAPQAGETDTKGTSQVEESSPTTQEITRISSTIAQLYDQYRHSLFTFAQSPYPAVDAAPELELLSISEDEADHIHATAEFAMSKHQHEMMLKEGSLWSLLLSSISSPDATISILEELEFLMKRSDTLTKSYEKRNNPPTAKTYDECKEILSAMGVPWLESQGPFEAEALAASLVLNGLADFVASEDTDVLVYEAPLLRNVTSRNTPLLLLSGSEIRTALQLSRPSFIDFALLLGTDFSSRLKGLGPMRAIKLIRSFGSIEQLLESPSGGKYLPDGEEKEEYMKRVGLAREVFATLPPTPAKEKIVMKEVDEAKVRELLERCGLGRVLMEDGDDFERRAFEGDFYEKSIGGLGENLFADNPRPT